MTYEYAVFFKLLLLCGYNDDFQEYIDNALIEQNPLSDIILKLSTEYSDDIKSLSILNEFLSKIKDEDIDYNSVFELIIAFLKRKYVEDSMPMGDITYLMYRIAKYTERFYDEPWQTMYFMSDLFADSEAGYVDKKYYKSKFDAFINDKICFGDYPPIKTKESFFKKIIKKINRFKKF